jgi:hypothetical protein
VQHAQLDFQDDRRGLGGADNGGDRHSPGDAGLGGRLGGGGAWHGGGWGGGWHGGGSWHPGYWRGGVWYNGWWGPAIAAGVVAGALATYPYWGGGYGYGDGYSNNGCWQYRPTYDANGQYLGQNWVSIC